MADSPTPGKKSAFDEIQALKILYENIVKIIVITVVLGIIVAGFTLMMPNIYESSAAIIIKAPEIPVAGEMPPLRVETLKLLAESPTIKLKLFDDLKTSDILSQKADFRDFNKSLRTWTGLEQGREKVLLPVVKLIVATKEHRRAAAIAQGWANLVLGETRELYNSGVDELTGFTQRVLNQAQKNLTNAENLYTSELLGAQLAVNKALLKANQNSHATFFAEYLKLNEEAHTQEAQLEDLLVRLNEQEINNVWVGELYDRIYRNNGAQQSGSTEPSPEFVQLLEAIKASTTTLRIQRTIEHTIDNERLLAQFEEDSKLQFKKMDLINWEQQLALQAEDIQMTRNLLAKSETQYQQLEAELKKLKPTIPLSIGIMQSRAINFEIANPVFQLIQEKVINLSGEIKGLNSRVEYYSEQQETYQTDVSKLAREIATEEPKREALQKAIDKDKAMLTFMEEEYNKLRQGFESMKLLHSETLAKALAKEREVLSLATEIGLRESKTLADEDKLAALKRNVDSLVQVHTTLAAKAEEVALLTVAQKGVSRSGAILLYEARANPDKVAPHRRQIVLMAMLIALIASSALIIVSRLIRDN